MNMPAKTSGQGALIAGGAAVLVVVMIAAFFLRPTTPTVPDVPAPLVAAVPQPAGGEAPETTAAVADVATLLPPRLSLVSVEPDGSSQVAGFAEAGSRVELLLDGTVIGSVPAERDGTFYFEAQLPGSDMPRSITVRAVRDDLAILSDDEVLVQPVGPGETGTGTGEATAVAGSTAGEATSPADMSASAAVPDAAETTAEITAAAAPALIRSSPEGVSVVRPAIPAGTAPEVMSSVALDTISYSQGGDVQLAGRGGAGEGDSFVRIYLDNRAVVTQPIAPDGSWRTDLPQVDTGVYTLRVDQVDGAGQVVSRVETPFQREAPEALAQAQAQTAQAITVQPGSTLWAIARDRYGEGTLYLRVYEANRDRIRNPDLIYPGQIFDLPE